MMRNIYAVAFLLLIPWLSYGQVSHAVTACIEGDSVVNVTMDYNKNCPEADGFGALTGLAEVALHSGANGWASVLAWNDEGALTGTNDDFDVFSVRINPSVAYGVEMADLVNINVIPNQGLQFPDDAWAASMRDSTDSDGAFGASPCSDMIITIADIGYCEGSGPPGDPVITACETDSGTVQIVFDYSLNCPEATAMGSLAGMSEIGFHSGINGWNTVVQWNDDGAKTAANDGNDVFSVEFDPSTYYGSALADITEFNFVYNQGPAMPDDAWTAAGRDSTDAVDGFGNANPCSDFLVMTSDLEGCDAGPDPEPMMPHIELCETDSGTVQFVFDYNQNCPDATAAGSLAGMNMIGFHSGINGWSTQVDWDADTAMQAMNDGNDIFTVEVNPDNYYGTSLADISVFNFVYNQGPLFPDAPWDAQGQDTVAGAFGGNCGNFNVMMADVKMCGSDEPVEPIDPEIPHISGCVTPDGEVEIVFDGKQNCPEAEDLGTVKGMSALGFHSGINDWATVVQWNDDGAMTASNDGNDVFTVRFNIGDYYAVGSDTVDVINFVYNQGATVPTAPWDVSGRDTVDAVDGFGNANPCSDFRLVLDDLPYCRVMPAHIEGCVTPEGEVKIVFDNTQNCPEAEENGTLDGMLEIGYHSGINGWSTVVQWNDSTAMTAKNNGLNIFTVQFDPAAYYGMPMDSIEEINFVYNQGPEVPDAPWDVSGRDTTDAVDGFGNANPCSDFRLLISEMETCETPPAPIEVCMTEDNNLRFAFDHNQNCPEATLNGSLEGQRTIGFHSGINNWTTQVAWDGDGAAQAVNDGTGMFSFEMDPASYYGVPMDSITEFNFLFNQGPTHPSAAWEAQGQSAEDSDGGFGASPCSNFLILAADIEMCEGVTAVTPLVDMGLKAYPNPFNESVTIEFKRDNNQSYELFMYDMSGRVVRSKQNLRQNSVQIQRNELSSGMYMIMLRSESGQIDYERVVIQ